MVALGGVVWFSNLESAEAIGLSMPPAPVVRFQPSYEHPFEVRISKMIARKNDRISYKSNKEILFLIYLTDPRVSSNEQILKVVKKLRGGSWGLLGTVGLIILIFSMGEGFVPNLNDPGWGLDRPNPFQPPSGQHRFLPSYNLFLPRRTDRSGLFQIMANKSRRKLREVNPQSTRQELTQVSTIQNPTNTKISGFVKNEELDIDACFKEVNRRASEIDCENFECSFERFKALATEDGKISAQSSREAISVLQGEMLGYYTETVRIDYGR